LSEYVKQKFLLFSIKDLVPTGV